MENPMIQSSTFPKWEEMETEAYLNFLKIVNDAFAGRINHERLFKGAMERLKGYYERGVQNPQKIKKFKGWFFVKCRSALRDERRDLLELRKKTEQPIVEVPFDSNVGTEENPNWKQAVRLDGVPPTQVLDLIEKETKNDVPAPLDIVFFCKHIENCQRCARIDWLTFWPEASNLYGPGYAKAKERFLFTTGLMCNRLRALLMSNHARLGLSILERVHDPNLRDQLMEEIEHLSQV